MGRLKFSNQAFINLVLWGAISFSALALVYHIRWFIPFLLNKTNYVVPSGQMPLTWFLVQIVQNFIFLVVGFLVINLFRKFHQMGFFDRESLKVFNLVIVSCVVLGFLGAIQTLSNNFYEVHFQDWTSTESIVNLVFRSFTRLFIFKEPQTLYYLIAIILWAVKQFVGKALLIKKENESFV